jgi:hypothetical protein
VLVMMTVMVMLMVMVMTKIVRCRQWQQQPRQRQLTSILRALHHNISARAAASTTFTTAADARVHQQRITRPAAAAFHAALNRSLQLQRVLLQAAPIAQPQHGLTHAQNCHN